MSEETNPEKITISLEVTAVQLGRLPYEVDDEKIQLQLFTELIKRGLMDHEEMMERFTDGQPLPGLEQLMVPVILTSPETTMDDLVAVVAYARDYDLGLQAFKALRALPEFGYWNYDEVFGRGNITPELRRMLELDQIEHLEVKQSDLEFFVEHGEDTEVRQAAAVKLKERFGIDVKGGKE